MAKRKFNKKNHKAILDRPIVLMGFMACGKTTVAKEISQFISWPYADLDDIIVKDEGLSIPEIFDRFGESGFRKRETKALKSTLSQSDRLVLALGGGTPCFSQNIELIKKHAVSIYLQGSPQLLFDRLKQKKYKRPLISKLTDNELKPFISRLLTQRRKHYMKADYKVRVNTNSKNLASRIIEQRLAHYMFS